MQSGSVWVDKYKYDDAEMKYFTLLSKPSISIGDYKLTLKCVLSKCLPIEMYYQWKDAEKNFHERKPSKGECLSEHDCSSDDDDWVEDMWTNKNECNDAERRYYEWCAKGLSKCNDNVAPEDYENEVMPEEARNPAYNTQCLASEVKYANFWACKEPEKRYFEWRSVPSAQLSSSNGYAIHVDTEKCNKQSSFSDEPHKNVMNEVSDARLLKLSNDRETTKETRNKTVPVPYSVLIKASWPNKIACHDAEKVYREWLAKRSTKKPEISDSLTKKGRKETKESKRKGNKRAENRREGRKKNPKEKYNVSSSAGGTIADKIASCRQHIQKSLGEVEAAAPAKSRSHDNDVANVITDLKKENAALKKAVDDLRKSLQQVITRVTALETANKAQAPQKKEEPKKEAPKKEEKDDDDDDVDLFGSDSEEEDEKAKEEREKKLAAYAAKKAKKPGPIAKSNVIFDVKPWDDETDMKEMERLVRSVSTDGLLWGASKLVPLAYGIKKLQISSVVEDEKVSIDWLQETIEEFEDLVQSVDIAAFNKI